MGESISTREGAHGMDPVRAKVDEWLTGVEMTRTGVFDSFIIEGETGAILVDRSNVNEIEHRIRTQFGNRYPDLSEGVIE